MDQPLFLWGATAISGLIGATKRQTFYLLESGYIPARKIGGRWCADRERLIAFLRGE